MNIRLLIRNLTNSLVHLVPRAGWIHLLKSLAAQRKLQDRLRFHVLPYRYDSPIPLADELDLARLKQPRLLPGVRFDEDKILPLLDQLQPFAEEFGNRPLARVPDADFWFRNNSYEDLDAITLYSMVRQVKPRRIIEVGCGHSSRVMSIAARRNAAEGRPAECSFIEPYPSELLKSYALAGPLIEKRVEHVPLETFQQLQPGDILFIDTSHVVKAQNDCCYELLTLIPSLPAGVYVHVHDIFTPFDYPEEWLLGQYYFNEQYALECLLTHNPRLEVILPVYWLNEMHRTRMLRLFAKATVRPAAFWMQTL
jgi:hypothetical protein